jgi:hypothetical protein
MLLIINILDILTPNNPRAGRVVKKYYIKSLFMIFCILAP